VFDVRKSIMADSTQDPAASSCGDDRSGDGSGKSSGDAPLPAPPPLLLPYTVNADGSKRPLPGAHSLFIRSE
jgi:hypothetical protein